MYIAISWVLYPPPFLKKRTIRSLIYHGKSWSQPETHGTWSRWPQVGVQVLLTSSYCPKRHRIPHHPYRPSARVCCNSGHLKRTKITLWPTEHPILGAKGQTPTQPPSYSLHLHKTGDKHDEKLLGWNKARKITYQWPPWENQTQLQKN